MAQGLAWGRRGGGQNEKKSFSHGMVLSVSHPAASAASASRRAAAGARGPRRRRAHPLRRRSTALGPQRPLRHAAAAAAAARSSAPGGTPATVSNGVWYHIAYTFDGTTHRLYINGSICNTGTTTQLAGTITAIYINGYPGGGTAETGTFSVDDISYFSRTLSSDEVLTAYTTAGDRDGIRYGCTSSILFSEGATGATANNCLDYTGNGNSLTPIGAATGVNFTYSASYIAGDTRPPLG